MEKDERILLEVKIRNSDNVLAGLSLVENRYGSKGWESGAQNTPVDDRDWRVYKVEFIPEQRSDFITLGIYFLSTGIIEVEYIKIERGNESLMFRGATQLENEWNFRTNYSKTHTK